MEPLFYTKDLSFKNLIHYKDLSVPKDKTTFITGNSGCGKSTLLKLFNASNTPSSGTVFYNNKNISTLDILNHRKEVSLVSPSVFLFNDTIKHNFSQFCKFRGVPTPSDSKILEFLSICNLDFELEKDISYMSSGEQQRLYIAMFISFLPKVLLLDEPTANLDAKTSNTVMSNLLTFSKDNDITLIVVSHDTEVVSTFSENTVNLEGLVK